MRHIRSSAVIALSVLSVACGGDGPTSPSADGGGDTGGGTPRTILAEPSFATNINEILQRRGCATSGCHGSGAGGLRLTSTASDNYAALVGVAAIGEDFDYVVPNDATNSYLVIKIENRQSVGQRMPLGSSELDNIDQTNIRNWINNGAPNN
jgi:hypothetical protein